MAAPSTPRHKRLAISDHHGNRSSSTPPTSRINPHLLASMAVSPSSRHSSPGIDRMWNNRQYANDVIPRRLTASPVPRLKDKDRTRKRLCQYHSIDHAVDLLKNAKKIVVLTGAGISTSLNIPDFRSDDGFYSRLSSSIGISQPEEFFSMDFFKHNSEVFWDNVKALLPRYARSKNGDYQHIISKYSKNSGSSIPKFSKTHAFLALLHARDKLLTDYTQNIDGLEYASGVRADKIIQCHGSWDTATCLSCKKTISAKKYLPIVYEDGYPRCKCAGNDVLKTRTISPKKRAKKRKRHIYEGDSDHDSDNGTKTPTGLYKPDITFFGESIPEYYVPRLEEDKTKADLLLVLGTSLKVRPVKTMVIDFPPHIPQIWINRDRFSGYMCDMPGVQFDIELLGECDIVIEELCRRAEFNLEAFTWKGGDKSETVIPSRSRQESAMIAKGEGITESKNGVIKDTGKENSMAATAQLKEGREESRKRTLSTSTVGSQTGSGSGIRVESDLDAEWRWRFSRKPAQQPFNHGLG